MPRQSYGLEDGSCSYKDFSESRNNRFSTPEQAAKNRIQHPSNVLHFFNAPLEVTEENFFEVRPRDSGCSCGARAPPVLGLVAGHATGIRTSGELCAPFLLCLVNMGSCAFGGEGSL